MFLQHPYSKIRASEHQTVKKTVFYKKIPKCPAAAETNWPGLRRSCKNSPRYTR